MSSDAAHSVIKVYQRHGSAWARLRSDSLVERQWLNRFCELIPAKGDVVDIGCGSGLPIARELTLRGFKVTGVDSTSTMLSMFQHNVPQASAHLLDMRQLALRQRFSGLLAWDSFFHLCPDDQRAMFPRFAEHALPDAPLMFTSGIAEGDAIGELAGEPLYHGSLDSSEYRSLLEAYRFELIAHVIEDPTCGFRTIWLARQRG